ncbi:MAG: hypothetical protein J7501_03050 [Bdellovibrio sp.]|nr:hypothetical protein [Bdellovibrio sp.]
MKLSVLFLALCLSAQAHAIREVRNGGGGMRSDAGIETFLSANLYLAEKPEAAQNIPGLTRLMAELAAMPIKESIKGQLFSAIYPTLTRNYYRVKDDAISDTTRKSIIEKYALMTHIPESKVVLLAASGWDSQTTVLFKEFYQLKDYEQAAILFHEALWLLKPELTYEQVVAVEQEAQKFFQNHNDKQAYYNFLMKLSDIFNDNNFYLFPLLSEDFQAGIFQSLLHTGRMVYSLFRI